MKKVAVIGAGAVGLYYGARLAQAGGEVHFLARRDFDALKSGKLKVESRDGDFSIEKPLVHSSSAEIGPADWVICALKATAADAARELIKPVTDGGTRLLVLMNGMGLEERFSGWFESERIFTGIAFTCINRGDCGTVRHLDYGAITIGHFLNRPEAIKDALSLWEGANVEVHPAQNFLLERWVKQCWNVPFNGLGVLGGGLTTRAILSSGALRAEVEAVQREVVEIANADLQAAGGADRINADETVRHMMESTERMEDYRSSTILDFLAGKPMEVDAIFSETARRAKKHGVSAPRVGQIAALLEAVAASQKDGRV